MTHQLDLPVREPETDDELQALIEEARRRAWRRRRRYGLVLVLAASLGAGLYFGFSSGGGTPTSGAGADGSGGPANPLSQTGASSRSEGTAREWAMIELLNSQGITFTPASDADRAAARKPIGPIKSSVAQGVPHEAGRDSAVYLGRLREVKANGGWAVVEWGSRPAGASDPVDRLAYVTQVRHVRQCSVLISCPGLHRGAPDELQQYDAFINARSGYGLGGIGFPRGYDPAHPRAGGQGD
jgi:hypothetical protein